MKKALGLFAGFVLGLGVLFTLAAGNHGIRGGGVAPGNLTPAVQDMIPYLLVTLTDSTGNTGVATIQAKDAADNDLAQRFLARVWIADAAYSEPDAQTTFNAGIGEIFKEWEENAWQDVISDATGKMVFTIEVSAPKTVHVMAEIDGRIYTKSVAITN